MSARRRALSLVLLLCFTLTNASAFARSAPPPPDRWVGTWSASPMAVPNDKEPFGTGDVTLREIVHVSLGGPLLRVILTNEFGTDPLVIGGVHAALSSGKGSIGLLSANALTFNGSKSITIPPGASAVSDPAALALPAFADLAISIFLPAQPMHTRSEHSFADQTSYAAPGNVIGKASLGDARELTSWTFMKGVEVMVPGTSGAVVCFGDSITDGALSSRNANARWPDILARRLQGNKQTRRLGVLNEGIGGNRVLADGTGPNALARFDRDVLAQSGVKYLIILEGINDIGNAFNPAHPSSLLTPDQLAAQLMQGLAQLTARAHGHSVKVYAATLTPFIGAGYSSPAGEQVRQTVNQWIRTSNLLDGFIDFDKVTRDNARPEVFASSDDSGDHLHPGDRGYKQMGDSIDLKFFEEKR